MHCTSFYGLEMLALRLHIGDRKRRDLGPALQNSRHLAGGSCLCVRQKKRDILRGLDHSVCRSRQCYSFSNNNAKINEPCGLLTPSSASVRTPAASCFIDVSAMLPATLLVPGSSQTHSKYYIYTFTIRPCASAVTAVQQDVRMACERAQFESNMSRKPSLASTSYNTLLSGTAPESSTTNPQTTRIREGSLFRATP